MNKIILKRLVLVSLIIAGCFSFVKASQVTGEKFIIEAVYRDNSTTLGMYFFVLNSSGNAGSSDFQTTFSASGITSEATLRTATVNAVVSWATSNGYSGTVAADVLWLRPTFSYNDLLDKPSMTLNNNVSRTLNSSYTISSTREACVSYSINASWTLNALLSGTGSAFLEYSTDSGSTWVTVNQVSKTLNLLTIAGGDDMNLTGCVPPNALVRLRTTSSNMTVSYVRGQEMLN